MVWTLIALTVLLLLAHVVLTVVRSVLDIRFVGLDNLYTVFGLWAETSVGNWFGSVLLLCCAGLLTLIAVAKRVMRDRYRWHWAGLAVIFLLMSIDEGADAHGQVSYVLNAYFQPSGLLLYAWVVPGVIFVLLFGIAYARFLVSLPGSYRWRFGLAGSVFVAAALVLEMVQARHDGLYGVETMTYKLLVTVEEMAEKGALILFIATLMRYISEETQAVRVRIG